MQLLGSLVHILVVTEVLSMPIKQLAVSLDLV